ncbi:Cell morphogenesis protein PAG1 [Elasticomyces elasticus]|nr:Cell morphogenesis protein PAG1 [Elasticomyces elasticus]
MVAAVLPWLQMLELQVMPDQNAPTDLSYMLLVNMIEITIRCGRYLHNEVQALWQALANGASAGNIQLILDFVVELCLDRREQNFVEYAKQVVVYLSTTSAGSEIFSFFLMQLAPKNMPSERRSTSAMRPTPPNLPYVADMDKVLTVGSRQTGLSIGQLALVFLVDLLIPPVNLGLDDVVKLVHAVFALWDHHTLTVQDAAREMLVHIIHVLIVARVPTQASNFSFLDRTEDMVDAIRENTTALSWSYSDFTEKPAYGPYSIRVPPGMQNLAKDTITLLGILDPAFVDTWARQALHWASVCSVRHLACRSFQVFRCISTKLDASLLSDMLARLSNTISNQQADYQTFSLEILTTIRHITVAQPSELILRHPQLFWTAIACLSSVHEREYFEALGLLETLMHKLNLGNPATASSLSHAKPVQWEGDFAGIDRLIYSGLMSGNCYALSLQLLRKTAVLEHSDLLGTPKRLLFTILAQLPHFLDTIKDEIFDGTEIEEARELCTSATIHGYGRTADVLEQVAIKAYRAEHDLIAGLLTALSVELIPGLEKGILLFTINMLNNPTQHRQIRLLQIVEGLGRMMKDSRIELACSQLELTTPLLSMLQTTNYRAAMDTLDLLTSNLIMRDESTADHVNDTQPPVPMYITSSFLLERMDISPRQQLEHQKYDLMGKRSQTPTSRLIYLLLA